MLMVAYPGPSVSPSHFGSPSDGGRHAGNRGLAEVSPRGPPTDPRATPEEMLRFAAGSPADSEEEYLEDVILLKGPSLSRGALLGAFLIVGLFGLFAVLWFHGLSVGGYEIPNLESLAFPSGNFGTQDLADDAAFLGGLSRGKEALRGGSAVGKGAADALDDDLVPLDTSDLTAFAEMLREAEQEVPQVPQVPQEVPQAPQEVPQAPQAPQAQQAPQAPQAPEAPEEPREPEETSGAEAEAEEEQATAEAADEAEPSKDRALNAVVWALDSRLKSTQRALDSLRSLERATEVAAEFATEAGAQKVGFAYVMLLLDGAHLSCSALKKEGSTLPCSQLKIKPSDTTSCQMPTTPKRSLRVNHVYLLSLVTKHWKPVYSITLDRFANEVQQGLKARHKDKKGRRDDLVFSHSNHARFILDYVFLQFSIEQALWLDLDTCVVGKKSVYPLFKTGGKSVTVAAYRHDSYGKVVKISKGEDMRRAESFVKGLNFRTSFNAGVSLYRIRELCKYRLLEKMIKIQHYHNTRKRLWKNGVNQPSFELAVSNSLTMVSYEWNCRLQTDTLQDVKKYGVAGPRSPIRKWANSCRIFHPAVHDMSLKEFNCSAFRPRKR